MYGMIHRCIVEFTNERLQAADPVAPKTWEVDPGLLISASPYDDAKTLELVAGAAQALNLPLADFMTALGRYWIVFAGRGSYAPLMRIAGDNLVAFLRNLDHMHECVKTAIPGTRMPYFTLESDQPGLITVRYESERSGLEPFVLGLMEGLMHKFSVAGRVVQQPADGTCVRFDLITAAGGDA